jgi:hypothetical protein
MKEVTFILLWSFGADGFLNYQRCFYLSVSVFPAAVFSYMTCHKLSKFSLLTEVTIVRLESHVLCPCFTVSPRGCSVLQLLLYVEKLRCFWLFTLLF